MLWEKSSVILLYITSMYLMKKILLLGIFLLFSLPYSQIAFAGVDLDVDGIRDIYDECPETLSGALVESSWSYIGCSSSQKNEILRDIDRDGILNVEDMCPNTPLGGDIFETGNYQWCTESQKSQKQYDTDFDGVWNSEDAFPNDASEWINTDGDDIGDNTDTDDDNDSLSDIAETNTGWTVRIPVQLNNTGSYNYTVLQVISNPLLKDSDSDGVFDNLEKERWLNPNNRDTDDDGVFDGIDQEITPENGKMSVNTNGYYTEGITQGQVDGDSDRDTIPNSEDICPNTPANQVVDETGSTKWCTEWQKLLDSDGDKTPDYRDNDADNDTLIDQTEKDGWLIQIPMEMKATYSQGDYISFTGASDTRLTDTDNDGLNDFEEYQKKLNPANSDTDNDGVLDAIDQEITAFSSILYVDTTGRYSASIYQNADDDKDGVKNVSDICPGTPTGGSVYTSGLSIGCTTSQKSKSATDSDFDGVPNSRDTCPGTNASLRNNVDSNGCASAGEIDTTRVYSMNSMSNYANNISIGGSAGSESSNVRNNDKLIWFNENDQYINVSTGGEKWLYNSLIRIAKDIKNLFFILATIFFLVITLKLIFTGNTEEEVENFKKGILWITVGIIVMQIAYAFVQLTFDRGVSAYLGATIIEYIVYPLIALLQTLTSLFFIAMAFFAFYRIITANGNEESIKTGKMTIVYALIGFLVIRFAKAIVEAFYGRIDCESFSLGFVTINGEQCTNTLDISEGSGIIIEILNWLNGFVAIVVLLMILYAGAQILLSGWDDEKLKNGKHSLIYIAIGLLVLVANYLILTFFLVPESII